MKMMSITTALTVTSITQDDFIIEVRLCFSGENMFTAVAASCLSRRAYRKRSSLLPCATRRWSGLRNCQRLLRSSGYAEQEPVTACTAAAPIQVMRSEAQAVTKAEMLYVTVLHRPVWNIKRGWLGISSPHRYLSTPANSLSQHTTATCSITMPGKHVHFEDYSLNTPSPSWTVNSLPSTTGPITPPNSGYGRQLPMSPMQYQSPSGLPAQPHPILSSLHQTPLAYDVSLPAATASITDPKLSLFAFSQAATEPALPYLEIAHPRLPWKLVIQPSVSKGTVVTVADVLAGIHAALRTNVTAPEFQAAGSDPMDPGRPARITTAYQKRCARVPYEARNKELKKGLKRIDFLEGENMFEGLANTKYGPHLWCMKTSTRTH